MQVYDMQTSATILAGSDNRGYREPYGDPTEYDWE